MSKMDEFLTKKLICIEGDHEIVPEFGFEDGSAGIIRCVVCGLVYLDSEDVEYSMRLVEKLKQRNLKEVSNDKVEEE